MKIVLILCFIMLSFNGYGQQTKKSELIKEINELFISSGATDENNEYVIDKYGTISNKDKYTNRTYVINIHDVEKMKNQNGNTIKFYFKKNLGAFDEIHIRSETLGEKIIKDLQLLRTMEK